MSTDKDYLRMSRSIRRVWRWMNRIAANEGVAIDPRWQASLTVFLEEVGKRPEGAELVRLDTSKGFFADNCNGKSLPSFLNPPTNHDPRKSL